jgi:hypothetical protein
VTDQKLWNEIQRRIARKKAKQITMADLRDKLTAEKDSKDKATIAQLEALVQKRIQQGKLHHTNGFLFLPTEPPPFGAELPPGRKKKVVVDPRQARLL